MEAKKVAMEISSSSVDAQAMHEGSEVMYEGATKLNIVRNVTFILSFLIFNNF